MDVASALITGSLVQLSQFTHVYTSMELGLHARVGFRQECLCICISAVVIIRPSLFLPPSVRREVKRLSEIIRVIILVVVLVFC